MAVKQTIRFQSYFSSCRMARKIIRHGRMITRQYFLASPAINAFDVLENLTFLVRNQPEGDADKSDIQRGVEPECTCRANAVQQSPECRADDHVRYPVVVEQVMRKKSRHSSGWISNTSITHHRAALIA